MAKNNITKDELSQILNNLSYLELKELVEKYSVKHNVSFQKEMDSIVIQSLEEKLLELEINTLCPDCDVVYRSKSDIVKYGKRGSVQVFKCKKCGKKFTLFSGTILEKTKWHWDIWLKVLELVLNDYPIHAIQHVLINDLGCAGINYKTVWLWRMKLIHAMASIEPPVLTGVVQVDETFVRESQKGSRNLVSFLDKEDVRKARYGYRPSKLGSLGPEFATIVAAVDNRGYCVCKVSSLGGLTQERFDILFDDYIDSPSYLCTDANTVYNDFCEWRNIPHYVRPSNYSKILEQNGYETPDYSSPVKAEKTKANNLKILQKLYEADVIDKIANRGKLSFEEFNEIKTQNKLSLGRVNELHSDIKKFIYADKANVSTKYLQDYIGYFTFRRNWRVSHGHYPTSAKDAEEIFIEILKAKVNYTVSDVEKQEIEFPKPSGRKVGELKKQTYAARKASGNKSFKFNSEDGFISFNKREFLLEQPKYRLFEIAKELGLKKYRKLAKWSIATMIMKADNCDEVIFKYINDHRLNPVDEEDIEAIKARAYVDSLNP